MTEDQMRAWIDGSTYEGLLSKWRFAAAGDPFFYGEMGRYYKEKMAEKREAVGHDEAVRASKNIGWER